MRNNRIISFTIIVIMIFILVLNFNFVVYGAGIDVLDNTNDFKPNAIGSEPELTKRAGVILGVINVFGVVASVLTLMVLGIKYMMGSVEEKAEYKKTLGMYLLGAFLAISITTIPNILYNLKPFDLW